MKPPAHAGSANGEVLPIQVRRGSPESVAVRGADHTGNHSVSGDPLAPAVRFATDLRPVLFSHIVFDLDRDALAIEPVGAILLGTEIQYGSPVATLW
jgi:hypothetical protein